MGMTLASFALLVPDYDAAIAFFVKGMGFDLLEDRPQPSPSNPGKRWVRVGSAGSVSILLAQAVGAQVDQIGKQGGGRVWLFLHTDDFDRDQARLVAEGARFEEEPRHEPYGTVAVFCDPWGNRWDLIQPASA